MLTLFMIYNKQKWQDNYKGHENTKYYRGCIYICEIWKDLIIKYNTL